MGTTSLKSVTAITENTSMIITNRRTILAISVDRKTATQRKVIFRHGGHLKTNPRFKAASNESNFRLSDDYKTDGSATELQQDSWLA